MINNRPEILAPCGNMESYFAAEHAGADAVYLAGKMFGARAYAGNFSRDELLHVLESAHIHGVRVYLTLNTILKESEMSSLYEYLSPLYEAGLDGILIQDFGVLKRVREMFPLLPIHTSTQMNVCSTYGAKLAKELGAVRVVPARELALSELKQIKEEAHIEVEAFVHGAMCFCYSGRCLLSAMAGGRSGNRGRCAQPCRQKYGQNYIMSMKDMCTLHSVPELMKAGIDSLKIEGRMKSPYYVASCIEAYRMMEEDVLSHSFTYEKAEFYQRRLAEIFNRGMFSKGYLFVHHGEEMLDVKTPGRQGVKVGKVLGTKAGQVQIQVLETIHKQDILGIRDADHYSDEPIILTSGQTVEKGLVGSFGAPKTREIRKQDTVYRLQNTSLQEEIKRTLIDPERKLPVDIVFSAYSGAPVTLQMTGYSKEEKISVKVTGNIAEYTEHTDQQEGYIKEKLGKLGNTPYYMRSFRFLTDGYGFIRASELNQLRREAVERFIEASKKRFQRQPIPYCAEEPESQKSSLCQPESFLRIPSEELFQMCLNSLGDHQAYQWILYPLYSGIDRKEFDRIREQIHSRGERLFVEMPLLYRDSMGEDVISTYTKMLQDADGVVLTNIDTLQLYRELTINKLCEPKRVILDPSLYVYNGSAIVMYKQLLSDLATEIYFIASEELSGKERSEIYKNEMNMIYPQYEKIRVMLTAQNLTEGETEKAFIKDKSKIEVIHNKSFDYDLIYLSEAFQKDLSKNTEYYEETSHKLLISFTNEGEDAVREILSGIKVSGTGDAGYFRGIE